MYLPVLQLRSFAAHFCKGNLPVAFVFSVPGAVEQAQGRPVSGDTGENFDRALLHLNAVLPKLFPSILRYDYRITNAFADPMAVSLGHSSSEAKDSQILDPNNVARVLRELEDCELIVLCGRKPRLLHQAIAASGKRTIAVAHVGNKGLNNTFPLLYAPDRSRPTDRRSLRVELWARSIMTQLGAEP